MRGDYLVRYPKENSRGRRPSPESVTGGGWIAVGSPAPIVLQRGLGFRCLVRQAGAHPVPTILKMLEILVDVRM